MFDSERTQYMNLHPENIIIIIIIN